MRKTFEVEGRRFTVDGPLSSTTRSLVSTLKKWKGNPNLKAPEAPPGTKFAVLDLPKKEESSAEVKPAVAIMPFHNDLNLKDEEIRIPREWIRGPLVGIQKCALFHRGMLKGTMDVKKATKDFVFCAGLKKPARPTYDRMKGSVR